MARLSWREKQEILKKKKANKNKPKDYKPFIYGQREYNNILGPKNKMSEADKALQARYNKLKQEGKL